MVAFALPQVNVCAMPVKYGTYCFSLRMLMYAIFTLYYFVQLKQTPLTLKNCFDQQAK